MATTLKRKEPPEGEDAGIAKKAYMSSKLHQRLAMLNDTPSKESLQTLARWCAFHRRPPKDEHLCQAFLQSILDLKLASRAKRGVLYLTMMSEVLLCDAPNDDTAINKLELWDKLSALRLLIGELVVVPAMEHLAKLISLQDQATCEECKESILTLIDSWESVNAFDSPSLTEQLRKLILNAKSASEEEEAPAEPTEKILESMESSETPTILTQEKPATEEEQDKILPEEEEVKIEIAVKVEPMDVELATEDLTPVKQELQEEPESKGGTEEISEKVDLTPKPPLASEAAAVVFEKVDFQKEGIPYKPVMIDQILKPCQSIATTQIARDLRHDFIERVSSMLQSIPASIIEYAKQEQDSMKEDTKEEEEIPIREDGLRGGPLLEAYPDDFLDLNMNDTLHTVEQYHNAVESQKEARSTCVSLLLSSHCKFGSEDAAKSLDEILAKLDVLKQTKTLLRDAMELEGIEMDEDVNEKKEEIDDEPLEPLTWYEKTFDRSDLQPLSDT